MGAFQAEFAVFMVGLAAFAKKTVVKFSLWSIAFTSVYCLVFTFSRGGYLGFLLGLFAVGLFKERKLLIVLAVILATWQNLVPGAVSQRVLMTYSQGQGLDSSAEDRVSIWQDAVEVIKHNPVSGTGFDTYSYMGRVGPYRDTHNYYLKILLETGVVGSLVFLAILGVAGRISWQLFRTAKDPLQRAVGCGALGLLVTTVAVNFFGDRWSFIEVNGFFWVILGLVARSLQAISQEQAVSSTGAEEAISETSMEPEVSCA
jgi:O-antigen ligase